MRAVNLTVDDTGSIEGPANSIALECRKTRCLGVSMLQAR